MKKAVLTAVLACFISLFLMSPSFVNAATYRAQGQIFYMGENTTLYELYGSSTGPRGLTFTSGGWLYSSSGNSMYVYVNGSYEEIKYDQFTNAYIPSLQNYTAPYDDRQIITFNNTEHIIFKDEQTYLDNFPVEPEPTIWDDFYEWFYTVYGFYPRDDSLIGLLRRLIEGDDNDNTDITFPTLTPIPSPTPTPTPIPVQTIFVPDGNGNTTIIYQYPDPTTGVITQSPYNPNIENNITVNCECDDDGNSNNIFSNDPTDPYTLTSSMLWADGFGVEITDNPLSAANDSQKSLAAAAAEYSDSVNVVSNSFNVLPFKWLMLVGLLGGILIIAGLIRTFLGG